MVNIPAAQIEVVENDRSSRGTPAWSARSTGRRRSLKSAIHELNFNAVWHLPPTVIEKDLIPKGQEMARRGQSVLVKFNIDAYGGDGKKLDPTKVNWSAPVARGLTYRQQPGPDNPLGFVKINFHNRIPSTCTTRRRNRCSGATSARRARAACACRASSSWPPG